MAYGCVLYLPILTYTYLYLPILTKVLTDHREQLQGWLRPILRKACTAATPTSRTYLLSITHYSLLTHHYFLLTHSYSLTTSYSPLLTTCYKARNPSLTTHYSLPPTPHSLLPAHHSLLPTYFSLPGAHRRQPQPEDDLLYVGRPHGRSGRRGAG